MRGFITLLVMAATLGSAAAGEFDQDYDPPEIVDCDQLGALGLRLSSDGCVLVYLYGRVSAGYDSNSGFAWGGIARARLAIVSDNSAVPLAGVLTVTSVRESYFDPYSWEFGYSDGTPRLDEAYLQLGREVQVRAGKVYTLLEDDLDETLAHLDLSLFQNNVSWSFNPVPWSLGSEAGFSPSMQIVSTAGGWQFGAGLEDLDRGGNVLTTVSYRGDGIEGYLSAAYYGLDADKPRWGVRTAVSIDEEPGALVVAGALDDSGYWEGLASGLMRLGALEVSLSTEHRSDSWSAWGGSALLHLTDTLAIAGAAETSSYGWSPQQLVAAGLVLDLGDFARITGELGYITDEYDSLAVATLRSQVELESGFGADVKGTAIVDGTYKIEASLVQRMQ